MEPSSMFVGINVSKAHLDVALHPSDGERVLPNTTTSIATLVTDLEAIHPSVIALESTGGDEWPVARALLKTMLLVIVVSPSRVRDFAVATGLLGQEALFSMTADIEARMLARFASTLRAAV
jgi:transposase